MRAAAVAAGRTAGAAARPRARTGAGTGPRVPSALGAARGEAGHQMFLHKVEKAVTGTAINTAVAAM